VVPRQTYFHQAWLDGIGINSVSTELPGANHSRAHLNLAGIVLFKGRYLTGLERVVLRALQLFFFFFCTPFGSSIACCKSDHLAMPSLDCSVGDASLAVNKANLRCTVRFALWFLTKTDMAPNDDKSKDDDQDKQP